MNLSETSSAMFVGLHKSCRAAHIGRFIRAVYWLLKLCSCSFSGCRPKPMALT